MDHLGFVAAAYAAAGILLGATTLWVLVDHAAQKRRLAEFERSELGRRGRPGRR